MVRVTCPEGRMQSNEPVKKLKTVRVLKPPGGGSSISFGDDIEYKKTTPVTSRQTSRQTSTISNGGTVDTTSPLDGPIKETPKSSSETPPESTSPTPPTDGTPEEHSTNGDIEKKPVENVVENGTDGEKTSSVDSVALANLKLTNGHSTEVTTNGDTRNENAPTTNGDASIDTKIPSPQSHSPLVNIDSEFEFPTPSGLSCPPTPEISTSSPSPPPYPLSPQPTESSKEESMVESKVPVVEKTPEPVVQPAPQKVEPQQTVVPSAQPAVKMHMRSSIFNDHNPEDDWVSRSRSSNGSVGSKAPAPVQQQQEAPQRKRIPPGGFSSKLW